MSTRPGDGRSVVAARGKGSFGDRLVVDCPACGGMAVITPVAGALPPRDRDKAARRMICHACGAARDQAETPVGRPADPFMGLRPRLRAETRHGDLIAWNEEHLDYLERYLAGRLRIETPDEATQVRNASVISRLPAWAKSARNREAVLKAISRLRLEKLQDRRPPSTR